MDSALSDSYLRFLADDEWDLVIGHLRSFRAAPSFRGCWPGWVFKTGKLGLGYYIDNQPVELALMKLAATSHATRRRVLPNLNTLATQKLLEAVETAPPVSGKIGRHLLETALRDLRKERGGLSCNSACLSLLADEAFVTEALTQGLQKVGFDMMAYARSSLIPAMRFARAAGVSSAHVSLLRNPYESSHYLTDELLDSTQTSWSLPSDKLSLACFTLSWSRRSRLDVAAVELVQLIASSSDEVEPVAIRILRTLLLESVLGHAYSIGYGYGGGHERSCVGGGARHWRLHPYCTYAWLMRS